MAAERLQKFLARAGVASRRKAEEMIANGRVKVNNAVVREQGTKVDADRDVVTVDGAAVHAREEQRYYLLYKPAGCVTTMRDPQGRPTAAEYLSSVKERVFPVGRLDYDAEGAVLFTTDGALANRLAHPRYGHARVYLVKVKPPPGGDDTALPKALARMVQGLRLEDGPARALEAEVHEEVEKNVWLRIVVGEGRQHLVKRLCEAVGLPVLRLFRPEFGGVSVEGLRPGGWRALEPEEVRALKRAGGAGGEPGAGGTAPPRRQLPKAARRHGHGPPAPPARPGAPARPAAPAGAGTGGEGAAARSRPGPRTGPGPGPRSGPGPGPRPGSSVGPGPGTGPRTGPGKGPRPGPGTGPARAAGAGPGAPGAGPRPGARAGAGRWPGGGAGAPRGSAGGRPGGPGGRRTPAGGGRGPGRGRPAR
jgi:23S rRNA pseudouridine2605 synthase